MNKLLNDYQLLELENQELRLRIAELKAKPKYPSAAFHLQVEKNTEGQSRYKILDECGYFQDSFYAESDEEAIKFFNHFKKNYKSVTTEIIRNGFTDNYIHCLVRYTSFRIVNLELIPFVYYVVKANKEKVCDYMNVTEDEAIAKYEVDIVNYINKPKEENKIVLI